jgi:hypothetical protein
MRTRNRRHLQIHRNSTFIRRFTIIATALLLALLMGDAAHMQTSKNPYDKERLLKIVSLNALSTSEIVKAIEQRGVDFQMNAEVEAEFKQAGARPELLDTMRRSYRPMTPPQRRFQTTPRTTLRRGI